MFKIGDTVIYGTNGVCEVSGIEERVFGGMKDEYYVLRPRSGAGSTVFVPIGNEKLTSRMKRMLSGDEVRRLIKNSCKADINFASSDNERRNLYKSCFEVSDRGQIISYVKAVLAHQDKVEKAGKKLHMCDERFLTTALKALYEEFTIALKTEPEDVLRLIKGE